MALSPPGRRLAASRRFSAPPGAAGMVTRVTPERGGSRRFLGGGESPFERRSATLAGDACCQNSTRGGLSSQSEPASPDYS